MVKEELASLARKPAKHPVIKKAKQLILKYIDKRIPITDEINIVALLDPTTKDIVDMEYDEKLRLLKEKASEIVEGKENENVGETSSQVDSQTDCGQDSKRRKLLDRLREKMAQSRCQSGLEKEVHVTCYLNLLQCWK